MRFGILIATALLAGSYPAAAQQAPADDQTGASEPKVEATETKLASAADVRMPASEAKPGEPAPVKKRVARVTTCRCGDPSQPQQ